MDYRSHDTRYGPAPCSLRVLCLHDSNSNASKLCHKLECLGERLYEKHGIDLVYVNSPLLKADAVGPSPSTSSTPGKAATAKDPEHVDHTSCNRNDVTSPEEEDTDDVDGENHNPRIDPRDRVWWEEVIVTDSTNGDATNNTAAATNNMNENTNLFGDDNDDDGVDVEPSPEMVNTQNDNNTTPNGHGNPTTTTSSSSNNKRYVGLDASLLLLRQIWTSMPFWGVLAVGDSAAVASFLPLLPVDPFPSFGIFINGSSLLEEEEMLLENWSCLHILGDGPTTKSSDSEKLIRQFGGQVNKQGQGAGGDMFTKSTLNVIGKFLVQQKKLLRQSNNDGSAAALVQHLQNQLYLVEQEAATLVAREIAKNPPNPLMAVITPQNVGGWSGSKRRGPNDEGGGAPCPSEFLLNREKRSTTKSTASAADGDCEGGAEASRVHPSEKKI